MFTWKNLSIVDWGIFFLIGLLPFAFALNPTSGVDLSVIRILIPIIFLLWLGLGLLEKKLFIDTRLRSWLLLALFLLSVCSIFWAPNFSKAFKKILFLGSIFPIYWVFYSFLKKEKNLNLFFKNIFFVAYISAIIRIFQFLPQFVLGIDGFFHV